MRRIIKIVVVCFISIVLNSVSAFAEDSNTDDTGSFDWEPVMQAVIQVESEGNTNAVKGKSCGAMQITPILVAECNNILKKRKSKKRYNLKDRFNLSKSKEMFVLIQSYFNPTNNIEQAIRSWNGGIHYNVKRTQRYFEKVMSFIK